MHHNNLVRCLPGTFLFIVIIIRGELYQKHFRRLSVVSKEKSAREREECILTGVEVGEIKREICRGSPVPKGVTVTQVYVLCTRVVCTHTFTTHIHNVCMYTFIQVKPNTCSRCYMCFRVAHEMEVLALLAPGGETQRRVTPELKRNLAP